MGKATLACTLLVLLCFTSFILGENVLVLKEGNFDEAIRNNQYILVEFFAPWCGHCKKLAPEYEKAATALKNEGSSIALASVDATVETSLAERFDIQGFPTLYFFKNGQQIEYTGPREAEGIIQWLKKKSGPPAKLLSSVDELRQFLSANPTAVIGFLAANSNEYSKFTEAADHPALDTFTFGVVTDPQVITSAGEKINTIRLRRHFDDDILFDKPITDAEEIVQWVSDNGYPYLDDAYESWMRLRQKGNPIGLLVIDQETDEGKQVMAFMKEIAKEYKDKFGFAYIGKDYLEHTPQMGGSGKKVPTMIVVNSKGQNYPYPDEKPFTKPEITAWLNDIHSGAIKPYFRSQPVPEKNDGPVKIVVGSTFNDIVLDETKDVLVEFYAPWCGHCRHLEPTYNQLGELYKDNKKVVIAKIDATANDNPSVTIQGYPTIYLFPAKAKSNPIEYEGSREVDDFVAFLEQHTGEKPTAAPSPLAKDEL